MVKRPTIHDACRDEHPCTRLFDELIQDIIKEANGKNRLAELRCYTDLAFSFVNQVFCPPKNQEADFPCECNKCGDGEE